MNQSNLSRFAPALLRWAMALVYLYFGYSQLTSGESWTAVVPEWATGLSGLSAATIVQINGTFEIIASITLALGVAVRPVALLLFAHLMVITFNFGFSPLGVRDFGLSFATLAVALRGPDEFCLRSRKSNHPAGSDQAGGQINSQS